jgi:hypothetical protein
MKHRLNYKLLIGIPLFIIAIGAVTVLVLNRLAPQTKPLTTTSAPTAPDPADIIKQYQASDAVGELANLYTKKTTPEAGPDVINYTADKSYTVYIKATDTVQFEQKDKAITTNSSIVKANSESFLLKKELQKKSPANNATSQLFTLFDSSKTVCQLFDLPPYNKNGALLTLACVKKSIINDQYTTINKLLALYSGPQSSIANPTGVILRTTKEDNKTLSVTDIYGVKTDSGATSLIFAAINDKWEYIGQRAISNGDTLVNNGISTELKAKLNDTDTKYQGFLKKNIQ